MEEYLEPTDYISLSLSFGMVLGEDNAMKRFSVHEVSETEEYHTLPDGSKHGVYIRYAHEDPGLLRISQHMKVRAEYYGGLLHGKYISYHDSGNVHVCCQFLNGRMEGIMESFFDSGSENKRLGYKNGLLE